MDEARLRYIEFCNKYRREAIACINSTISINDRVKRLKKMNIRNFRRNGDSESLYDNQIYLVMSIRGDSITIRDESTYETKGCQRVS